MAGLGDSCSILKFDCVDAILSRAFACNEQAWRHGTRRTTRLPGRKLSAGTATSSMIVPWERTTLPVIAKSCKGLHIDIRSHALQDHACHRS